MYNRWPALDGFQQQVMFLKLQELDQAVDVSFASPLIFLCALYTLIRLLHTDIRYQVHRSLGMNFD